MRFVQLKQAERRSRFLKNERFFTFFKKSAEQRLEWQLHSACRAARNCSFIHILAHSSAFSLILPPSRSFFRLLAHFSPAILTFLNKKTHCRFFCAISCSFFSLQRACRTSIMFNFLSLNHFSRLRGTSVAPSLHFKGVSGRFREVSRNSRALTHAFDRPEKAPNEDKN